MTSNARSPRDSRSVARRLGLLATSLAVAAVLFFAVNFRDKERNSIPEVEETTFVPYSGPRYGAAAQFPQGTNPPIGVERSDAVSSDARVFLEEARRDGGTVTAFGRFTGGVPECALLNGSGKISGGETEVAGDTFLFTATVVDPPGGELSVRCSITDRFFADGPPQEEMAVN